MTMAEAATTADRDETHALCDAVRAAVADRRALYIEGGGSKRALCGRHCAARVLSVAGHRGIVRYQPEEMVITARAGTPLADLVAATTAAGQMLPFEAPLGDGRATLGGALATGLSGPARPWRGSVRDAVLGVRLINGHGELLRFGGEVMKNVAGYDVSRLQSGALGTLGVIAEVSLRVLPRPQAALCLVRPGEAGPSLARMRELAARALPLSGACWRGGALQLRLEGSTAAVEALRRQLPDFEECDASLWQALVDWSLPELCAAPPVWVLDVAPATPLADTPGTVILDWAGARRVLGDRIAAVEAQTRAARGNGHALAHGCGELATDVLAPPPAALRDLLRRVKAALDPHGVFNPGRLHAWL